MKRLFFAALTGTAIPAFWLSRRLMKLLFLVLVSCSRQYRQMLHLLEQNLREWREIARLDSSCAHYREIAGGVLLMYAGEATASRSIARVMAWNLKNSITSGSKEQLHGRLRRRSVTSF